MNNMAIHCLEYREINYEDTVEFCFIALGWLGHSLFYNLTVLAKHLMEYYLNNVAIWTNFLSLLKVFFESRLALASLTCIRLELLHLRFRKVVFF